MSVFFRQAKQARSADSLVPPRSGSFTGSVSVTADSALRTSVVWAALRLRADLVSTFPLDCYRKVDGRQVEVPKPPVLIDPQGDGTGMRQWLYSTQFDLDRVGNAFGIITAVDGAGKPREIQLVDHATVTVLVSKADGTVSYRIGGKPYTRAQVWHERQFTVPGMVMGLSPIAYAAWSIGVYQSAQQFALEWFANGAQVPSGHFKNVKKELTPIEAGAIKDRFKAAIVDRDVMVTGNDWEYSTIDAGSKDSQFIEAQNLSEVALCRFFGAPASAIDVNASGQNVTYANLSQDLLRLLVLNMQPSVTRREDALSNILSSPRFVKLNTDALLRMDPKERADVNAIKINSFTLTPDEARGYDNLPPLTDEQWAEFARMPKAASTQGVTP